MANSRPQIPSTNLKERIAALEQRNAAPTGPASRATSPTPTTSSFVPGSGAPPTVATGAGGPGALRDKIAKFERKGGVPVPRGRFGLGAPPPAPEGAPRRPGELYGNRIPPPSRSASAIYPRSTSPGPSSALSSPTDGNDGLYGYKLSPQVTGAGASEFGGDSELDYTPVTSPTFAFPPDSPSDAGNTPLASPPLASPDGSASGASANRQRMLRGTSFAQALDFARAAGLPKVEGDSPASPATTTTTPRFRSPEPESEQPAAIVPTETPLHDSPVSELPPADATTIVAPIDDIVAPSPNAGRKTSTPSSSPPVKEPISAQPSTTSTPSNTASTSPSSEPSRSTTPTHLVNGSIPRQLPAAPTLHISPPVAPEGTPTPALAQIKPLNVRSKSGGKVEERKELTTPSEPPSIVVRKAPPTGLDEKQLSQSGTQQDPLQEVVTGYLTGRNGTEPFKFSTPKKSEVTSPISPDATLAYAQSPNSANPSPAPPLPQPNIHDLLSPPQSGALSAPLSSPEDILSASSTGSRPLSMSDIASPGMVTRALRVTPAISKGVPTFLPPNTSNPRKSEFVHFPPTPTDEDPPSGSKKEKNDIAVGYSRRSGSESDLLHLGARARTNGNDMMKMMNFPEPPRYSTIAGLTDLVDDASSDASSSTKPRPLPTLPQTPRVAKVKRATILEPPMSPGQGELVSLLQEAVLLEGLMDLGELPGEALRAKEEAEEQERRKVAEEKARREAQAKEEERRRIALAAVQQAKREEPSTQAKLKHTFLIPLSKARSAAAHRKETSAPASASASTIPEPAKSTASLPPVSPSRTKASMDRRRPSESGSRPDVIPPPSKSPKSRIGSAFKRLGTMSRSSTAPVGRKSMSTSSEMSSSEDSNMIITPSDSHLDEFGMTSPSTPTRSMSDISHGHGNGHSGTLFPSLSPRKSSNSLGRAATFAEKMWSRARTRSNGSSLSSPSEIHEYEDSVPRLPPIGSGNSFELPPFSDETTGSSKTAPVRRSGSMRRQASTSSARNVATNPAPPVPPMPIKVIPQPAIFNDTPHSSFVLPPTASTTRTTTPAPNTAPPPRDFLSIPGFPETPTAGDNRPSSAFSIDSAGSLPSPLFDQALFDAFPSVPQDVPVVPYGTMGHHKRDVSMASTVTASFDTAFLNSAIHLGGSSNSNSGHGNGQGQRGAGVPATAGPMVGTFSHTRYATAPPSSAGGVPRKSSEMKR